jgi:hypothetical protein
MGTFSATFLGHQGWLLRSQRVTWLVDPLLREGFGDAHALGYQVYPPRVLDLEALPEVDAVFLTHEHDDHFDIPSLALLDRTIPIFLSARSSSAARSILDTMGFEVVGLEPGVLVEQGDLELVAFAGDHLASNLGDEWDALPISVRHRGGDGSFFSMVDVALTQRHVVWARAHVRSPGLVTWSNNTIDLSHMAPFVHDGSDATPRSVQAMRSSHDMIVRAWGQPVATLVCAGGFAFTGERAWLNERIFAVDTGALCDEMSRAYEGARFDAPTPGQTFWMENGRLARVEESTAFLRALPREEWPARKRAARGPLPDYGPATGRRSFSAQEREELESALRSFAATLVGGVTFKSLHSLLSAEVRGRRLALVFALRHDGPEGRLVFEYEPSSCSFRPVATADPEGSYLAGLSCWATDLLAILRGELGPIAIQFGRATLWNALPGRFRFDVFDDLYRASHPLRRPEAFLRIYERLWRMIPATPAVIRAHRT